MICLENNNASYSIKLIRVEKKYHAGMIIKAYLVTRKYINTDNKKILFFNFK